MKRIVLVIALMISSINFFGQENSFEWDGRMGAFKNGLEHQVAYINLGNAKLWGYIEVTITGGFGYRLTTGKYTKRFQIAKNLGDGYFYQSSEVATNFGHVGSEWKIGEIEFVNNNLRVAIYHLLKTGNTPHVSVKGMSLSAYDTKNITISPVTTLVNNETRDYVSFNTSNIGIGTTTPDEKLTVKGNVNIGGTGNYSLKVRHINGKSGGSIDFDNLYLNYSTGKNVWVGGTKPSNLLIANGKLGVGRTDPDARLSVRATTITEDLLGRFENITASNKVRGIRINSRNSTNIYRYFDIAIDAEHEKVGFGIGTSSGNLPIGKTNLNFAQLVIDRSNGGSVGIGTQNTFGYKLAVNGNIGAKEVKVEVSSAWPDFVFAKEYNLPTLSEVENHIKEKGYLEDIPSAEEVKNNGFFLGGMNAKLLQKIEELTLYTIQQEKEIQSLKDQKEIVDTVKKENKELKERLTRIEELVYRLSKK